jgi:hypothetical protein
MCIMYILQTFLLFEAKALNLFFFNVLHLLFLKGCMYAICRVIKGRLIYSPPSTTTKCIN